MRRIAVVVTLNTTMMEKVKRSTTARAKVTREVITIAKKIKKQVATLCKQF